MNIPEIDLEGVQRFIGNGMSDIVELKNDVSHFWSGPAATLYQEDLLKTIDFSKLSELITNLDIEVKHTMGQLTENVDT